MAQEQKNLRLGGYEVDYVVDRAQGSRDFIVSLKKNNKSTLFSYKFYEKHKSELERFSNILNFVKPEQNRKPSDRVSVNLENGQSNTLDADKLALGSYLLLKNIKDKVSVEILNDIIALAKEKATTYDSISIELKVEIQGLVELQNNLIDVFGKENDIVKETQDKIDSVETKLGEREKELLRQ